MNCEEIKTISISYIQNELAANQREIVGTHLSICEDCSNYYAFINTSLNQVGIEKRKENDPFYFSSLMAKMENQKSARVIAPIRVLQTSALVAAMFIAILGGSLIGSYGAETLNYNSATIENVDDNFIAGDFTENDFDLFNDL